MLIRLSKHHTIYYKRSFAGYSGHMHTLEESHSTDFMYWRDWHDYDAIGRAVRFDRVHIFLAKIINIWGIAKYDGEQR